MVKTALKSLSWGVISWVVLNVLIFFGAGFLRGLSSGEINVEVSPSILFILRYAVLLMALAIAGFVFYIENRKLNIVVGPGEFKSVVKELPKPVFRPEPIKPAEVPMAMKTMPVAGAPTKSSEPPKPPVFTPKPFVPNVPKPAETPQPKAQPFWPGKPFSGFESSKPAEKPQPIIQPFKQNQPSPPPAPPASLPRMPILEKPTIPSRPPASAAPSFNSAPFTTPVPPSPPDLSKDSEKPWS